MWNVLEKPMTIREFECSDMNRVGVQFECADGQRFLIGDLGIDGDVSIDDQSGMTYTKWLYQSGITRWRDLLAD